MKAVILAGGKGTRLGKKCQNIPKSMVKIGPFSVLEHQINFLRRNKIKEIIILTSHLSHIIEKRFKKEKDILCIKEEKALGTAGAIKNIENKLKEDFLVLYGDVMLDINIKRFVLFHKKKKSDCVLFLHPNNHPDDSDLVEIGSDNKIIGWFSKPRVKNRYFRNFTNGCFYIMSPKILKHIKKGAFLDFGKDVFPEVFQKIKMHGYVSAEYIKDMGTPERLKQVIKDYKTGKIKRFNIKNKRKAIFLDRDGTINKDLKNLSRVEDFELYPFSAKSVKKINDSEFLAIVVTNQPVVAKGFCSIEDLEEIHKKMETLLGREGAKLDAIYYCPHHPEKGHKGENKKYKIECNCRKSKTGMILKAKKDFNIDLKNSYIIGDSERDILCGKRAGLKTIRVKTGEGIKKSNIKPDYSFDNLGKAVDYFLPG